MHYFHDAQFCNRMEGLMGIPLIYEYGLQIFRGSLCEWKWGYAVVGIKAVGDERVRVYRLFGAYREF